LLAGALSTRQKKMGSIQNGKSGWTMSNIVVPESLPSRFATNRRETERACLALVQTELEVAFSYLHSAQAKNQGDKHGPDAAGLISKAITTHNTVLRYLANVPMEFEAEKHELYITTRQLFDAIRAEWCSNSSNAI
jgi:hypothetical protein